MKHVTNQTLPQGAIFIVLLIFLAAIASHFSGPEPSPLVIGIGGLRERATIPTPLPPRGGILHPAVTLPDWTITTPFVLKGSRTLSFGNNDAYLATAQDDPASNASAMNVYNVSTGNQVWGWTFTPTSGASPLDGMALDAASSTDTIGLVARRDNGGGVQEPYTWKFTTSNPNGQPIFGAPFTGVPSSASLFSITASPTGALSAYDLIGKKNGYYSASNTNGVPTALNTFALPYDQVVPSSDGSTGIGYHGSLFDVMTLSSVPATNVFSWVANDAVTCVAASQDGSTLVSDRRIIVGTSLRSDYYLLKRAPAGQNPAYTVALLGSLPVPFVCQGITISPDGKTVHIMAHTQTPVGSSYQRRVITYASPDGITYTLNRDFTFGVGSYFFMYPLSTSADGSRVVVALGANGHGYASGVQVYQKGENAPLYLFDMGNETIWGADLSNDGKLLAVSTCTQYNPPTCGASTIHLYHLDGIPTHVKGVFAPATLGHGPRITVTSDPVGGAVSYSFYRSTSNDVSTATLLQGGVPAPTFTDNGVVSGQKYYYWVRARVGSTYAFSPFAEVSTSLTPSNGGQPTIPGAPSNLNVTNTTPAHLILTWNPPTTGGNLNGFHVWRGTTPNVSTNGVPYATVPSTLFTYDDSLVSNGGTYYYKVTAFNTTGEGAPSNEAFNTVQGGSCSIPGSINNGNGTCTLKIVANAGDGDGSIYLNNQSSWSGVQNASAGDGVLSALNFIYTTGQCNSGICNGTRAYLAFPIPSLSGVTVSSTQIVLHTYSGAYYTNPGAGITVAIQPSSASPSQIVVQDYSHVTLAPSATYGSVPITTLTSANLLVNFPLSVSGKNAVIAAQGGTFTASLMVSPHLNGGTLGSADQDQASFYASEETNPINRPELDITYS